MPGKAPSSSPHSGRARPSVCIHSGKLNRTHAATPPELPLRRDSDHRPQSPTLQSLRPPHHYHPLLQPPLRATSQKVDRRARIHALTMLDEISDDLQSLSFGSSDRSHSGTAPASSSSLSYITTSHACTIIRLGSDLSINDLHFIQRLGSRDIDNTYLAELKNTTIAVMEKQIVAAKVMDKKELEGQNKQGRVKTKRAILEMLDHSFLPHLYGMVEDE